MSRIDRAAFGALVRIDVTARGTTRLATDALRGRVAVVVVGRASALRCFCGAGGALSVRWACLARVIGASTASAGQVVIGRARTACAARLARVVGGARARACEDSLRNYPWVHAALHGKQLTLDEVSTSSTS